MSATSPIASGTRPSTVTAACVLLYLHAPLVLLVGLAVARAFVSWFGVVVAVAVASVPAVLGYLCSRGNHGARIATWVFAALYVFCSANVSGFFGARTGNPVTVAQAWYLAATITVVTISIVDIATAAVLLAWPTSRPHFARPTPPG